jgi:prolipoprotein diacylglyceryltransferase/opacity protein-like surface antigen
MALIYSPPSPHGHFYYEASQLAAFALYVGLLLAQGYRRGYAWRSWLPLVTAATLALVLGCQLVFLAPSDWLAWLGGDAELGRAVAGGPRSVVGGAAFSLAAVLALRRALGFRGWAVLDAFAGPLCWALAVQSIGCGLAGCCWGEPTAAGTWGLVYGPGTPAYAAQLAQGLLPAGASHALPVVPTQLYHLLLCAGTGLALHLLRRRFAGWPGGSRYLLAMGLLCLGRWGIEFWRDAAGEPLWAAPLTLAGHPLPGLGLQWLLLLEATALLGGWAWLVRRGQLLGADELVPAGSAPAVVGLGLLVATARLAPGSLNLPEILVLQALLLAVLLAEARTLLLALGRTVPRLAGLPLSVLLGSALLLATAQAPAPQQNPPAAAEAEAHRLTFSVGTLHNQYDERPSSGCGSSAYTYGHRTQASGGEVAYQLAPDAAEPLVSTVGGGAWVGTETIELIGVKGTPSYLPTPDYLGTHRLYDLHLYAEGHQRWRDNEFGLQYRLGLHMGQLGYSIKGNSDDIRRLGLLPETMLAFSYGAKLFSQFDLGYGAENALGSYATRFGLGLGRPLGGHLLAGVAVAYHDNGDPNSPSFSLGFVSARLRLPGSTGLSAFALEPYFATNFDRHNMLSLKLSYRLGGK